MSEPGGEVIVYRSPDGRSLVQLRAVAGTVWLAQAQIAALYDTSVPNIAQLIRRISPSSSGGYWRTARRARQLLTQS